MTRARAYEHAAAVAWLVLLVAPTACIQSKEPTFPEEREILSGALDVNVSTTGANPDPDGYDVTIDESRSQPVGVNGAVHFAPLPPGQYQVTLSGVAANCTVSGGEAQSFTITSGATTSVAFTVACP